MEHDYEYIILLKENNNKNHLAGTSPSSHIPVGQVVVASKHTHSSLKEKFNLHHFSIQHIFQSAFTGFTATISDVKKIEELKLHPDIENIFPNYKIGINPITPLKENKDIKLQIGGEGVLGPPFIPWGIADIHPFLFERKYSLNIEVDADVYIIDTGVDEKHPHLNVVESVSFVYPESLKNSPYDGHGTHVAGIIAAKDLWHVHKGFSGVAPGVRIHSIRVLDQNGQGKLSWFLQGIEWCIETASASSSSRNNKQIKPMIVNMSLGFEVPYTSSASTNSTNNPLDAAIIKAANVGIIFVAAAGNSGKEVKTISPGRNSNYLISVGCYNARNEFCIFSNRGPEIDYLAPGVDIISTWVGGKYNVMSGTSMSTPHITGIVLLFLTRYPHASLKEVKLFLDSISVSGTLKNVPMGTKNKKVVLSKSKSKSFSWKRKFELDAKLGNKDILIKAQIV